MLPSTALRGPNDLEGYDRYLTLPDFVGPRRQLRGPLSLPKFHRLTRFSVPCPTLDKIAKRERAMAKYATRFAKFV